MIARCLGWITLVACLAISARAEADQQRKPTPAVLKSEAKATKITTDDPKPKKKRSVDDELLELTNDPLLGKADKIQGTEAKGMVTFTFDDGPNPETTPAVIDALLEYKVPATFFVVTRRLGNEQPRALLERMVQHGFEIASHTVSHPNLRRVSAKKLAAEIDDSIRTLAKTAARPIGLFRAPFGALDARSRAWLKKRGLTEAFWSIDTLDWKATDPERLRKKIIKAIVKQDGGVVLLHDVKPITAQIIANVLDDLEAENCKRLADNREPILPVSIHYFLRDNKKPRPIPDDVKKTTEAYRIALPVRCAARPVSIDELPSFLRGLLLE